MTYFVIYMNNGICGWTDDEEVVSKYLNSPWADFMGYTVEERATRPVYLDQLF